MSSVHSKLAQALVPLLTVSLLAMGCNDSTAPSSGETAASQPAAQSPAESQPAAQPPTSASDTSAGRGQAPMADTSLAPTVHWPAPGDSANSSPKLSFLVRTDERRSPWATSSGWVNVAAGAARCSGGLLRWVEVAGIDVGRTGGPSGGLDQYVTAVVGFYRHNGTSWVLQSSTYAGVMIRAAYPPSLPALWTRLPAIPSAQLPAGAYKVTVRFIWQAYVNASVGWVWTAQADYDFNAQRDYSAGYNARTYPGYCTIG
jgi:hypothetical protein